MRECYRLSTLFQKRVVSGEVGNTWKYAGDDAGHMMDIRRRWLGFVGGLSLSKYLDLPWHEGNPSLWDKRHDYGDVGDLDVRTRSKPGYELSIRPNDKRPAVLVKPDKVWDAHADDFHVLPNLFLHGFHLPWYVRLHGDKLFNGNVCVLDDRLLIDPVHLTLEKLNG